jgi:hypothetical protein
MNDDFVQIQAQNTSGIWITYNLAQNQSFLILEGMRQLQWQFPDARIRAVDMNGRLIDKL